MEETRIHKETGLLVRSDGAVFIRIRHSNNYHWTYGCKNNRGYMQVCYKYKKYLVHRLIAETFIPNPNNKEQVDHINMQKDDNRVENLRWCTQKENLTFVDQDVLKRKVANTDYKAVANKVAAKLSKKVLQLTLDGQFVREWESTAEADRDGYNHSNIVNCCNGKQKTHKGYIWRYA